MAESAAKYWALEMARRGFAVFPLIPDSKLPVCRPGSRAFNDLSAPHKRYCAAHPALAGGIHCATTNAGLIESWFNRDPTINYGVSTNDLVVLDADAADGKRGLETLKSLGKLPATFTVRSPRGGLHIYYEGPGTSARRLGQDVDTRSIGGYVVGPGSTFAGRPYSVAADLDLADLPQPLRARLAPPKPAAPPIADGIELPEDLEPLAIQHIRDEPGAIKGSRGITTYRLAAQLKDLGVSEVVALELLAEHWGPRCDPPLGADEMVEVAHAYQYGRKAPGCSNPIVEFEPVPAELVSVSAPPAAGGNFKLLDVLRGPHALPRRPWLVPGLLMQGSLSGLVAPPAAGKSTLVLAIAIGIALGRLDWMGMELRAGGPQRVVLVNNEDDENELLRRLYAICAHAGLSWEALAGQIVIHTDRAGGFLAFTRDRQSRQLKMSGTDRFREFQAVLAQHQPAMWSVDPFAEIHEGNENDSAEVAAVMRELRTVARRHNSAGLIIQHTRKPPQASSESYAGDPNATRGSGAFVANVRALATLYTMGAKEAAEYGISIRDHHAYTRLDMGKGSYTPRGAPTRWFKTVSVELDNGDEAPAIERATLTSQTDRQRGSYHRALSGTVAAGDGTMTYESVVEFFGDDPLLNGMSAKAIGKKLQELFGAAVTIDGVTMMATESGLRGWFER